MTLPILIIRQKRETVKLRAGLSLEAALVLAPCLILLTSLLFLFYAKLMALEVRYALENVSEDLAVLFPVADQALDASTGKAKEILDNILQGEDRSQLSSLAGDYASSWFLGPFLERRMDGWLERKTASGGFPVLRHQRQLSLHWGTGGKSLSLTVFFSIPTLFGEYKEEFSALVPLWSQRLPGEEAHTGEEDHNKEDDNIWSADNFSRGRYFRDKEGGNLPFNFPVIAYYHAGVAKSIKSMDLTAPSYQDSAYTFEQVKEQIQRLAAFHSHESKSQTMPTINPGDIVSKSLVLVIPENSPTYYDRAYWDRLEALAAMQGVKLEVKLRGWSSRYAS